MIPPFIGFGSIPRILALILCKARFLSKRYFETYGEIILLWRIAADIGLVLLKQIIQSKMNDLNYMSLRIL